MESIFVKAFFPTYFLDDLKREFPDAHLPLDRDDLVSLVICLLHPHVPARLTDVHNRGRKVVVVRISQPRTGGEQWIA